MTSCCSAVEAFLSAADLITSTEKTDDRHGSLFEALFSVLPCDAAVLLTLSGDHLVPTAAKGFRPDLLGSLFDVTEHPRLKAVLNARGPITFEKDHRRPSPFDGMLEGDLLIRMEMGTALRIGEKVVGALMIDISQTRTVDRIDVHKFSLFAALAAANLQTPALVESLKASAKKRGMISPSISWKKPTFEAAASSSGNPLL